MYLSLYSCSTRFSDVLERSYSPQQCQSAVQQRPHLCTFPFLFFPLQHYICFRAGINPLHLYVKSSPSRHEEITGWRTDGERDAPFSLGGEGRTRW